jgi:hypothetical protein
MQKLYVRPRFVKRLLCLAGLAVLTISITGRLLVQAAGTPATAGPAWAAPSSKALRRVSALPTTQNQSYFLSNLDCTPLTYRLVNDHAMKNGCFTPTDFGMLDSDTETVIFNNTDEGLALSPSSAHQVLAPWPQAANLVTLDAADVGGSYIGLYKNPVSLLQDQRDYLGQLTGKKLSGPPEILFKDSSGQPIRVNPQTMAFSAGGSWLVVETLHGSFVRINLATLDMTAFAPAFGNSSSPGLLKSEVTVSDNGRFVAIANAAAGSFQVYDLSTCSGIVNNLQPQSCQSYDYRPFINQQVSGVQLVRHVRFLGESLLSFEVTASNPAVSGVYQLAPTAAISSLSDYIALGDSYTSGEGAFDYLAGTDTDSNKCHLSAKSYPLLLTRDLFSSTGGHSVACSGAVIDDLGSASDNYRGQVKDGASFGELARGGSELENIQANFTAGYIAQHRFVQQYRPRVVTVSIGGNDIGFGDLLQNCVIPHVSRHTSDETCYNTYESRQEVVRLVDRTVPRWTALYRQLQAENPEGRMYAIGYPSIASDLGSCGTNVNLSKSELEFAEELIAYLNGSVRQAAAAAGVTYVDISHALDRHRLCEAAGPATAVNGLTAGNDNGVFGINVLGRESYHPNALGHGLIEQAILRQTDNLTVGAAATPAADNSTNNAHNLLNAPKSGTPINTVMPARSLANPTMLAGGSSQLKLEGSRYGLKPNTPYTVHLDGSSGPAIGTASADANGNLSSNLTIPAVSLPGGHTIDITGKNQADESIVITQPIYITVSANDPDGDGAEGSGDSCPYAVNSGQDIDQDAVDDICDSLIGTPPNNTPGPSTENPNSDGNNPDNGEGPASTAPTTSSQTTGSPPDAAITLPTLQQAINPEVLDREIRPTTATPLPNIKLAAVPARNPFVIKVIQTTARHTPIKLTKPEHTQFSRFQPALSANPKKTAIVLPQHKAAYRQRIVAAGAGIGLVTLPAAVGYGWLHSRKRSGMKLNRKSHANYL